MQRIISIKCNKYQIMCRNLVLFQYLTKNNCLPLNNQIYNNKESLANIQKIRNANWKSEFREKYTGQVI